MFIGSDPAHLGLCSQGELSKVAALVVENTSFVVEQMSFEYLGHLAYFCILSSPSRSRSIV